MRAADSKWAYRIGSVCLLLSLLGGHWWALQTVAWGRMLVRYSQRHGIREGVVRTFDGDHPCKLCLSIREGKAAAASGSVEPASIFERLRALRPRLPGGVQVVRWVRFLESVAEIPVTLGADRPPVPPPRFSPSV